MYSVWILTSVLIMTALAFTASSVSQMRNEHVIAAATTQFGAEVAVISKLGQLQPVFTFQNYSLSSGCGPHFRRCHNVLVKRFPISQQYIVFVPLENAIGILDFQYDGNELIFSAQHVSPLSPNDDVCNPVGVFEILRSIYTVCLKGSDLVVYEIILKQTQIMTTFQRFVISTSLGNFSNQLSNVIFISLGDISDQKHLFFTVGNYVYEITPHEFRIDLIGTLSASAMSAACNIAYAGDHTLIAYCEHEVVYFDLIHGNWVNQTTYAERGKPIICPNPDMHLAVYLGPVSYILYGLWSENTFQNLSIPGSEFHSGVCFGTQNKTFFAYNDRKEGVYILEFVTFRWIQLSSEACMNQCDPLLEFDDRYLVLRQRDQNGTTIIVMDSKLLDFDIGPSIIETPHLSADLIVVIPDLEPAISSTTGTTPTATTTTTTTTATATTTTTTTTTITTTTTTATTATTTQDRGSGSTPKLPIIAAALVALLSIFAIVGITVLTCSFLKRRKNTRGARLQQEFRTPGVGGDTTNDVGIEVSQDQGREDPESDIDYPLDSSCQSAEFRRNIEGNSAPGPPAGTFTSFTDSIDNSVEDTNSPSEITTPTSLRREEYMPEGSSNDNLDVTTQTVACTEDNPNSLSVDSGIYCARNNTHVASHPDVMQSDSCLESVQETDEPSQSASATTTDEPSQSASTTTTDEPSQSASATTTDEPSQSASATTTDEPSQSTSATTTDEPSQSTSTTTNASPGEQIT